MSLLQHMIWMIDNMTKVDGNVNECKKLRGKYRPLAESTNNKKINRVCDEIKEKLVALYEVHREDILEKDFTWMEEGILILEGVDVGRLYMNVAEGDDDFRLGKVNSDLLLLFYDVAPDDDKKEISEKHKKKEEPVAPQAAGPKPTPANFQNNIEKLISKNKDLFTSVEKDPRKMPEVLKKLMTEHSGDFADLLGDTLGNLGVDFAQLAGGK